MSLWSHNKRIIPAMLSLLHGQAAEDRLYEDIFSEADEGIHCLAQWIKDNGNNMIKKLEQKAEMHLPCFVNFERIDMGAYVLVRCPKCGFEHKSSKTA